jgi:RNA polymerase sigma-70 factor (ECF subfamily)
VSETDEQFAWLFHAEYPMVVRTVGLLLGDRHRAEEIAQDAFAALFSHWRKISVYERPDAWVRRVAVRMAMRFMHRERIRASLEWRASANPVVEPPVADVDLHRALHELPMRQRAAIVLFYFEDRPIAEIADILEISVASAKVVLHRARRRLGDLLGDAEVSSNVR